MIIGKRHNYCFIHIPKTGGSSITKALVDYEGWKLGVKVDEHAWQIRLHSHGGMHGPPNRNYEEESFCVVRDPWTRLASVYRSATSGDKGKTLSTWLDQFLGNDPGCGWRFRAKQYDYWVLSKKVILFEDLETEWARLTMGWPGTVPPLDHLNRSGERAIYMDRDSVDRIGEFEAATIERFGYEPPQ